MKSLMVIFSLLLSFTSFAAGTIYECTVRDASEASEKVLTVDGKSGKVFDSIVLASSKYTVQVELYFQNIQIHLFDENRNVIFSTLAPETTPFLLTSLRDSTTISCKRI